MAAPPDSQLRIRAHRARARASSRRIALPAWATVAVGEAPHLPDEIRKPLSEGIERDIRRLQDDLEKAVMQPGRSSGTQLAGRERMLRLVRANSFTAILKPGFPLELLFAPAAPPLESPVHEDAS